MDAQQQSVPLENKDVIINRIDELQQALRTNAPNYENMLFVIHKALLEDDAVVHLLTDEQIGVICQGLAKKKNVVLATATGSKHKLSNGKSLKDATVDDF